ncbi:hypothetical protein GCM10027589_09490 [Actinocorallia lasiicapitis]
MTPPALSPATDRYSRFLTVVAFLAVAALTAGAFVLSYQDLLELARAGMDGRTVRFDWIYPAMYDGLVVTGLLAVFVARNARWFTRALRWVLLVALIGGAITISVQRSVKGFDAISGDGLDAGVASAPWVAALLAIWLWMSMFRQLRQAAQYRAAGRRKRRQPAHAKTEPAKTDPAELIPGFRPEVREEQEPEEFRLPYVVQTAPAVEPAIPSPREPVEAPDASIIDDAYAELPEPEPEPVAEEPAKPRRRLFGRRKSDGLPPPATEPIDLVVATGVPREEEEEAEAPDTRDDIPVVSAENGADDPFVGVREVPRGPLSAADPYQDTAEDPLPLPPAEELEQEEAAAPPSHLPTDVKLVGRAHDTQPDFPAPAEDRSEDPDGGDDWAAYAPEWNPPSGSLRSSPTPPEE